MQKVFEKIIEQLESKAFERYEKKGMGGQMVIDYDDTIEIVKQKADKYNNGWIPCSERMPEDEQVVLTCKCKSISILRYSTKTNHWYELSGNWWWSANMVTAWQPLPEPYKES